MVPPVDRRGQIYKIFMKNKKPTFEQMFTDRDMLRREKCTPPWINESTWSLFEMKWSAKSNKTKSSQFGTKATDTSLNFFQLRVGNWRITFFILTHQSGIDSEISPESTYVNHRVILK